MKPTCWQQKQVFISAEPLDIDITQLLKGLVIIENIIQPSVVLAPSETTITPPPPGACDGKGALLMEDDPKGYIVSTGHPIDYLNNQVCEWVLKADENDIIQLTFLEFDLEDG